VTDRARRLLAEHGLEFVAVEPPSSTGDAGGNTTLDTEPSQTDAVDDSAHDPAGDATGDDDGEPAGTLPADEESH